MWIIIIIKEHIKIHFDFCHLKISQVSRALVKKQKTENYFS